MDSNALTHVAAIVVGVLVTLALVGTFSSSKSSSTSADDSRSSTDRNTNANTTDGGKKKKKKKKGGKNASDDSTAAADAKMEALVKEEENKENANNNKGSANGSNNNNNNDSGGGKKKKKKKNKGGSNANGSATSNGEAQATEAPKATPTPAAAPAPKAASTTSDGWQTVPPVEEEWESVGKNSKKGKKKVKTATVTAASKAPTAAAAGAPAAAAAASATDSVTVDAKKIGIIIGPKGATMMAIQEATGCKLDINAPGGKDDGPNNKAAARVSAMAKAGVIITGNDKESIAKAKKAVLELASKGYATLLQADPNFGEFGTEVHPRMLSEIVGPGGKTIQALQTSLNVKITIPPTDWKPNNRQTNIHNREVVKPVLVGIAGSKENAKTAKEVIKSLAKYHHHEVTHPGMIHEEVHVPREFFHCVIGPRGSEIKHIRGNYKVDMYMPNDDSATDNVLVVGRQANVEKAIAYIQLLMDRDAEKNDQKYTDEYY